MGPRWDFRIHISWTKFFRLDPKNLKKVKLDWPFGGKGIWSQRVAITLIGFLFWVSQFFQGPFGNKFWGSFLGLLFSSFFLKVLKKA